MSTTNDTNNIGHSLSHSRNANFKYFFDSFSALLNDISFKYKRLIIMGDFNMSFLKYFTELEEIIHTWNLCHY